MPSESFLKIKNFSYYAEASPLLTFIRDTSSLTQRLRTLSQSSLEIHIIRQSWQFAPFLDCRYLGLLQRVVVWVREIYLVMDGVRCVYARSLMPRKTLCGKGRQLKNLETKSLIDVLTTDPHLLRSSLQIGFVLPGEKDFESATEHLPHPPTQLWARRSIFYFYQKPLMVQEIFLPALIQKL